MAQVSDTYEMLIEYEVLSQLLYESVQRPSANPRWDANLLQSKFTLRSIKVKYFQDMNKNSKIYIAGHKGLVGSAIWNNLKKRGYNNLVGRSHKELDLTDQYAVKKFFDEERPDAVVLAAAFVGGIMANSLYSADFMMMNMKIQCNVIS